MHAGTEKRLQAQDSDCIVLRGLVIAVQMHRCIIVSSSIVSSSFVSMSAGWNMNAEDAAAFAAAQQMQAAEAAREAQRAGGGQPNAHQD